MKPSEIKAQIDEVEAIAAPIRAQIATLEGQLAPHEEHIEALRQRKADMVNEYGVKIRLIRDGDKDKKISSMPPAVFVAFRKAVNAAPEDDRATIIDAKLTERGLA